MIVEFSDGTFGVKKGRSFLGRTGIPWQSPDMIYNHCRVDFLTAQVIEQKFIGEPGIPVCSQCGSKSYNRECGGKR